MKFATVKDAKDFLAGRIAVEAEREGKPLTEVERKMLYFSESDWTLPDMAAVSAEFDRDYDDNEYELKIARLAHNIEARNREQALEEVATWDDAVLKLSEGDNYLTVLLGMEPDPPTGKHGLIPTLEVPAERPSHDRLKLWLVAIAVVLVIFAGMAVYVSLFGH